MRTLYLLLYFVYYSFVPSQGVWIAIKVETLHSTKSAPDANFRQSTWQAQDGPQKDPTTFA